MIIDVPDEFLEMLEKFERPVGLRDSIGLLRWASSNPEKAKEVAKAYNALTKKGRG